MTRFQRVQLLLGFQVALFLLASIVHRGWLLAGYEHSEAAVAESVIGAVLVLGLIGSWLLPQSRRGIAIAVQAFALLGTIVGAVMIAIGVGPQSGADVAIHVLMLSALILGLLTAIRASAA